MMDSILSGSFTSEVEALGHRSDHISLFGDAAQFGRRDFDFPSPHKREFFVGRDCISAGRGFFF